MLRDFIKNCFHLLPSSFRNEYRKVQFKNWENKGRTIPPPQVVKLFKIQELRATNNCRIFIETGTYKGDMIYALKGSFDKLITVELSPLYYKRAVEKFKNDKIIELHFGDAGEVMPEIINGLDSPAMFWLDGHFSSGQTAQGEKDCPIFGELTAIFSSPFNHVLLIDDARLFVGKNDYPTIPELKSFIEKHKPGSFFEVKDDLITVLIK